MEENKFQIADDLSKEYGKQIPVEKSQLKNILDEIFSRVGKVLRFRIEEFKQKKSDLDTQKSVLKEENSSLVSEVINLRDSISNLNTRIKKEEIEEQNIFTDRNEEREKTKNNYRISKMAFWIIAIFIGAGEFVNYFSVLQSVDNYIASDGRTLTGSMSLEGYLHYIIPALVTIPVVGGFIWVSKEFVGKFFRQIETLHSDCFIRKNELNKLINKKNSLIKTHLNISDDSSENSQPEKTTSLLQGMETLLTTTYEARNKLELDQAKEYNELTEKINTLKAEIKSLKENEIKEVDDQIKKYPPIFLLSIRSFICNLFTIRMLFVFIFLAIAIGSSYYVAETKKQALETSYKEKVLAMETKKATPSKKGFSKTRSVNTKFKKSKASTNNKGNNKKSLDVMKEIYDKKANNTELFFVFNLVLIFASIILGYLSSSSNVNFEAREKSLQKKRKQIIKDKEKRDGYIKDLDKLNKRQDVKNFKNQYLTILKNLDDETLSMKHEAQNKLEEVKRNYDKFIQLIIVTTETQVTYDDAKQIYDEAIAEIKQEEENIFNFTNLELKNYSENAWENMIEKSLKGRDANENN